MKVFIFLTFALLRFSNTQDILKEFRDHGCLRGGIESMGGNLIFSNDIAQETYILNALGDDFESLSETDTLLNIQPKTVVADSKRTFQQSPVMLINELAMYNSIDISYNLISEHGPAHQKIFTINLILGYENYEGLGSSLKRAKQAAAAKALKNTKYEHPPLKDVESRLHELAQKRNEDVVFTNEYAQLAAESKKHTSNPSFFPTHNTFKLNDVKRTDERNNTDSKRHAEQIEVSENYKQQFSDDPFMVRLQVGTRDYLGIGYTLKAARHDAALKAVEEMKQLDMEEMCIQEGCEEVPQVSIQSKSPVSLVYEIATKKDKRVIFSIVREEGLSHAKVFITRCQVDELVAEGEGKSKKTSKRAAAENMLEKLIKLGWHEITKKAKNQRKRSKRAKSSTINKEGVQISKDIPSAIYEKEPTLIKESEKVKQKLPSKHGKSTKDTLLELARKLGISVQFWDLPKNNYEMYLTFLSVSVEPAQVCFGMDSILETSREKASLRALDLLEDFGFDNIYTDVMTDKDSTNREPEIVDAQVIYDYNVKQ